MTPDPKKYDPRSFTPMKPPPSRSEMWYVVIVTVMAILGVLFLVLWFVGRTSATEYSMVSDENKQYCAEFARREAMPHVDRMPAMVQAYGDCIRILPTRLPMPPEPGSVPAGDAPRSSEDDNPSWREACAAEYRSWDEATGTVVRRGSPDRVECPLVLRDGDWVLPEP